MFAKFKQGSKHLPTIYHAVNSSLPEVNTVPTVTDNLFSDATNGTIPKNVVGVSFKPITDSSGQETNGEPYLGCAIVYIFTVDADTVRFSALLMSILALLIDLLVSRLLLRVLSNFWSPPVPTTQNLLVYAEKPSSRTKKARGGPWFIYEYYISCHLSKAFESFRICHLSTWLFTVFILLIKEGRSSSPVMSIQRFIIFASWQYCGI